MKICNREAIDQINIDISLRHNIFKMHSSIHNQLAALIFPTMIE